MTTATRTLPSGLMIQDTSDRPLQQKIADCCQQFKAKFGVWPKTVWLHAETLGDYISPNGLKLEVSPYCQPDVFLVGPLPQMEV